MRCRNATAHREATLVIIGYLLADPGGFRGGD
jgi:hypothetical protein